MFTKKEEKQIKEGIVERIEGPSGKISSPFASEAIYNFMLGEFIEKLRMKSDEVFKDMNSISGESKRLLGESLVNDYNNTRGAGIALFLQKLMESE